MVFEDIPTKRLLLRKITPDSLDYIYTQSDETIMALMGIKTNEELLKQKKRQKEGFTTCNKKFLYFNLLEKETEKVIGWAGYHTWYIDHDRAELGYWIYDDIDKQKGYMSEALSTILLYGFQEMNLHRIEAFIAPYNQASQNTILKFGFTLEGLLREHYFYDGKMDDSEVYSLLKREFKIKKN